ncbi:hypothetical protein CQW23_21236 [Capsicum baccatum]|uniref:Uncharacterized protein n=1 Tax=Capsicum baccatum TaxID=33114 RepID=A0A2G2VXJ2_CAPBA|nr:hypothetical protein CQW23_21236 [Capsicum baccatum]
MKMEALEVCHISILLNILYIYARKLMPILDVLLKLSYSQSAKSQPAAIAANVRAVFTCLLHQILEFMYELFPTELPCIAALVQLLQVSIYITEGFERARDSLTEAAALRERFVLPSVSRRVAAAAASTNYLSSITEIE